MVIHHSFPDFVLFLFVHLSHADSSYDPKELATIKLQMKNLYPADEDFEKKLYLALREYNALDKSKLTELFQASAEHFKNEKVDQKVLQAFQAILGADGKVDQNEVNALNLVKQIIGV